MNSPQSGNCRETRGKGVEIAAFSANDNVYSVYFPIGEADRILWGQKPGRPSATGKQTEYSGDKSQGGQALRGSRQNTLGTKAREAKRHGEADKCSWVYQMGINRRPWGLPLLLAFSPFSGILIA
jgi:hypothetical protein